MTANTYAESLLRNVSFKRSQDKGDLARSERKDYTMVNIMAKPGYISRFKKE